MRAYQPRSQPDEEAHTARIPGSPEGPFFKPKVPFELNEKLYLARGPYQGTVGTFVGERSDVKWADIRELDGTVRPHPKEWLRRCPEGELVWPDLLRTVSFNQQQKVDLNPETGMDVAAVACATSLRSE